YFALLREPQSWVALVGGAIAAALLLAANRWSRARVLTAALVLVACLLGGFSLGKLRADHVRAPIAPAQSRPERLEGWVVDVISPGQGGPRLMIAPARIGHWPAGATPVRVHVTLRGGYLP